MNKIEYYYNIINYFFYRAVRAYFKIGYYIVYPAKRFLMILAYKLAIKKGKNISFSEVENIFEKEEKNLDKGTALTPSIIVGGGISISVLSFIFLGIWHLIRNYFFPTYQDNFVYSFIIIGLIAYTVDNLLVTQRNQGAKYLKIFNKKKGWWRIKWATIASISPIIALSFAISTSSYGFIGKYILSVNGYTQEEIIEMLDKKKQNTTIYQQNSNGGQDSEQDILKKIRQYTPDRID